MIFFKKFKIKRLIKKIKSMQAQRLHNQPSVDAIKREQTIYHNLATIYLSLQGKKNWPFARINALECYRASAVIEDAEAHYLLAKTLLDEAKIRDTIQRDGIFASPSNERQMAQLYEEAFAHLKAAEQLNHIQAKRLYGLCYIKGWGVAQDQDHGFEYIIASIEQENSWDKVPQIFVALDLNKPEFFSALMRQRGTKKIS